MSVFDGVPMERRLLAIPHHGMVTSVPGVPTEFIQHLLDTYPGNRGRSLLSRLRHLTQSQLPLKVTLESLDEHLKTVATQRGRYAVLEAWWALAEWARAKDGTVLPAPPRHKKKPSTRPKFEAVEPPSADVQLVEK